LSPKTSSSTVATPTIGTTAAVPAATATATFTDIDPQLAQHVEDEVFGESEDEQIDDEREESL
ncbi:unnamed protein product, partial [Rotaria sp. Silwood1]